MTTDFAKAAMVIYTSNIPLPYNPIPLSQPHHAILSPCLNPTMQSCPPVSTTPQTSPPVSPTLQSCLPPCTTPPSPPPPRTPPHTPPPPSQPHHPPPPTSALHPLHTP